LPHKGWAQLYEEVKDQGERERNRVREREKSTKRRYGLDLSPRKGLHPNNGHEGKFFLTAFAA
jgi:hypothetical protein